MDRQKKDPVGKKRKRSRLTGRQKALTVIAILLAMLVLIVAACQSLFVRPDLPGKKDPTKPGDPAQEAFIDYGDGTRPKADGARKSEDYYTVLILGRDTGGGGNTDTMLLASYDVTNQKATVMSIPRDTMVNVPWDIKRINSVYNYYGGGDKGIKSLYKEISQLVGFEPDYQVVVEWEAVGKIVDAMGGVWFDVPRDMNYEDPYQDLVIHQTKGYRKLTGDDAMQVLRYRHDNKKNGVMLGYPDGDLGRIKTQQALLKAMVEQLLKLENITKVNQFVKVFQENVETDMSFQNILWFAKAAYTGGLNMSNVNFVTMPNKAAYCWSRTVKNNQSYVVPNAGELLTLVNDHLSPFVEPSTMKDLDIMSVNADGSVSSTTGRVEDAKAAKPPVKPVKPEDKPAADGPVVDGDGNVIDPETGEILPSDPGTSVIPGDPTAPETPDPAPADPDAEAPAAGEPDAPIPADPGGVPEVPAEPIPEAPADGGDSSIIEPPPAE